MQGVRVSVSAALWNKQGVDQWGEIVFERIKAPWPDPEHLREHVGAAVREARATADIAAGEIRKFDAKLRGETAAD
jgi:hypothetical protein